MLGLIGAMELEVNTLIEKMSRDETYTKSGIAFHAGILYGKKVVIAKCGAGKVNAAVCAQTMLLQFSPEAIINIGVAGGVDTHIGDLVIADRVMQYDYDTTPLGEPLGFLSGLNQVEIPCDAMLNEKLRAAAEAIYPGHVHGGLIATGDQFVNSKEKVNWLKKTFSARACEMEGGAIGHVCALNKVPFAVLRSISDNANDESHTDFMSFCVSSAQKYNAVLQAFLEG